MSRAGPPPPRGGSETGGAPPPTDPTAPPSDGAGGSSTMVMAIHLLGLVSGFVGPLILFLTTRDDPRVRRHAAAALNWQLSFVLYVVGVAVTIVVLVLLDVFTSPLFFLFVGLIIGLVLYNTVVSIVAAIKSNNGARVSYPGAISMVAA